MTCSNKCRNKNILVAILSVLVIVCVFSILTGCNTIAGIGEDMKALAQGTQDYLAGEPSTDKNFRNNYNK
jgi:predicted small secreted protein